MKIGHDENFLCIERVDKDDPYSGYAISARCEYDDSIFSGSNGAVHFDQTPEAKADFREFEALNLKETRLDLTENCFLQLTRLSRGDIQIDFQICRYRLDAKFVGRIELEGEYCSRFLKDLGQMAFGD